MHGNFDAFVAVPRADMTVTREDAPVRCPSSADSRRAFCESCGARVAKEISAAGRWLVSAGLIDGFWGKRIIRNLWEQSKPDRCDLPEVTP
ncbi:hypothetical protein B6V75_00075 [Thioclava sp. F1Mire-8]|nr:hypothetical protein B6V75_00075 [Thioclava sp. F1Mire-8]